MRAQRISYIETTHSWYYVYDENDKHSAAPHFTSAVPKLGAMTVDDLYIERFEK